MLQGARVSSGTCAILIPCGPAAEPRNYNGQTGAVQGYEAAREAALAAFAKRAKPLELLPAALLHWSKRRGRALIPPIESAAHELSMQLPTQRYNDANPPLLWRLFEHASTV